MKNLNLLLIIALFSANVMAQIPNSSFENWSNYSLGEVPDGWTTDDSIVANYGGGNNVYKGTDPFDGSFSIHMKTVQIMVPIPITGPGVATNGKINFNSSTFTFVFSGGTADTTRYGFLRGQFKYNPLNPNDEGQVSVAFLKDNAGVKDTIATGVQTFTGVHATYEPFTIFINYRNLTTNPDTFLIIMQSSRGLNHPNNGIGTELVIDSLHFTSLVGINEPNDIISSVNVFPTPAKNFLNVNVEFKQRVNVSYSIFDLNGKKVLTSKMDSDKQAIDISKLANGNYIINLTDQNNNILHSTNFAKQ